MKNLCLLVMLAVVVGSCGSKDAEKDGQNAVQQQKDVQSKTDREVEIAQLEKELLGFAKTEKREMMNVKAENLLKRYRDYISMNPRDSMAAEYLFKAADLSVGVGKPDAAIKYLDRLINDFPSFRKRVEMMLFRGFIYETYLNNHAEAVKAYKALIERYPNHRLAQDAKASIENLTMSEADLIKKFKKMNEKQSTEEKDKS